MLEITETLKSEDDLLTIIQEVNTSPFIARLSKNEISRFIQQRTVRFIYEASEIQGFVATAVKEGLDQYFEEHPGN